MGRIPPPESEHGYEGSAGVKKVPRYHPLDVGPNWFLRDWIEGESELAKPIVFPEDVQDFRGQQHDLAAALSAAKDAKRAAQEEIREQKAEKYGHFKRVARAWSANSIGLDKHVDYKPAAKAGTFFQTPIIDDQPSKRYIKNPLLSGMWDGLPGHLPPHHQPNVYGVWNNCSGQNDVGKALGEFGNVPPHRQAPKEKEYSEAVEKRVQYARRVEGEEALRKTCGTHKRQDLLAKAHPASVLKGEKPPWIPGEENRYFSYVPDMVEPMVCDHVMAQVLAPSRAYDHARQIVSGSAVSTSFWVAPKIKYHGTQRREASAKELLKNHHGPPSRPPSSQPVNKACAETAEKGRPSTAPTMRRAGPGSRASSAGKSNASEAVAKKAIPRSQSATVCRPRSNSLHDAAPAPRPQSATAGSTNCAITVHRPPSTGIQRTQSAGAKPRPSTAK